MARHRTTKGLLITDRDPGRYVEELENAPQSKSTDDSFGSLGIGSLKSN